MILSKIFILGAGGPARSTFYTFQSQILTDCAFVDLNKQSEDGECSCGLAIFSADILRKCPEYSLILGISDIRTRKKLIKKFQDKLISYPLVAESAILHNFGAIGIGSTVHDFAYVGPHARIGNNSVINTSAVIEHDVTIGENCFVAPRATILGGATIGSDVFIGAGATILPKVNIKAKSIVGAGAVVISDVESATTVLGIPAK